MASCQAVMAFSSGTGAHEQLVPQRHKLPFYIKECGGLEGVTWAGSRSTDALRRQTRLTRQRSINEST